MILHIVRHGQASGDSPTGRDADRVLTARGQEQAAFVGAALAQADPKVERLVASPLVRAQQTAAALAPALKLDVETDWRLATSTDLGEMLALLNELGPVSAIVGHNPHLSELAGLLVAGVGATPIEMQTGQCCTLEVAAPIGPACAVLLGLERLEG